MEKIHMFKDASFGDLFETRNGGMAVYIGNDGDQLTTDRQICHALHIYGYGYKRYYEDGYSIDGIVADDIVAQIKNDNEECELRGWQIAKITDCLTACSRFIKLVERRNKRDDKRIESLLRDIGVCKGMLKL
jgi:hypothetical protein